MSAMLPDSQNIQGDGAGGLAAGVTGDNLQAAPVVLVSIDIPAGYPTALRFMGEEGQPRLSFANGDAVVGLLFALADGLWSKIRSRVLHVGEDSEAITAARAAGWRPAEERDGDESH